MSRLQKKPPAHNEAIQHFKTWIFSTFVGHFCPPGYGSVFKLRIRIQWSDWIRIQYGSGSETLQKSKRKKGPYCKELDVSLEDWRLLQELGVLNGSLRRNVCTSEKKLVKAYNPRRKNSNLCYSFINLRPALVFKRKSPGEGFYKYLPSVRTVEQFSWHEPDKSVTVKQIINKYRSHDLSL